MCLPCCADVYVEAEPKKKKNGEYYWDPVIKGWVKLTGVTPQTRDTTNGPHLHTYIPRSDGTILVGGVAYVPQSVSNITATTATPLVYQQPGIIPQPQPVYNPYAQQPYIIQQQPSIAGLPNFTIMQPSYGTYGQTGTEVLAQQMAYAQASNINEKQEMKPADDDPYRMYWVRELDNSWTQRNRLTIDSGDIGDCRWYAIDGQFYAVRLATG
ncbi:hypothetical protein L207DRAFT_554340 [Hyaloscypha variabilis F]|uniref:Uncharacterized protein n=1 Tax=Hyaloscypha variabilis (strain UAMH 11265 / GT02V1 / F) TaxID=1149755 RepID=A0A2J6RQ70_HYAVF|nr:hypothetical protein L207DRAFT_554340 [Hyaloscypha variabilis F]